MECPFVEGQQVICIDDEWSFPLYKPRVVPRLREIYTVSFVYPACNTVYLKLDGQDPGTGFRWNCFDHAPGPLTEFLATRTRKKPRQKTKENV